MHYIKYKSTSSTLSTKLKKAAAVLSNRFSINNFNVTLPKSRNIEYQILNLWRNFLTVWKKAEKTYNSLRLLLISFFK